MEHHPTHQILSSLIQSAVGILLDNRNAATGSKPNIACITTVLERQKLFWACAMYKRTNNNKCQCWELIFTAMSILNYVVHNFNGLDTYIYFMHCACISKIQWCWVTTGQTTHMLLLVCYIQHITLYVLLSRTVHNHKKAIPPQLATHADTYFITVLLFCRKYAIF